MFIKVVPNQITHSCRLGRLPRLYLKIDKIIIFTNLNDREVSMLLSVICMRMIGDGISMTQSKVVTG
jgi:hypothetical protein